MNIKKLLAGVIAVAASSACMAAPVLSEGFDDTSTLAAKGWVINNLSTPLGAASWFQGNAIEGAYNGPAGSHIGVSFLSADIDGGTVSNWLFTPVLNTEGRVALDFALRLVGDGFLDTVEVYYSTAGSSTNLADFKLLDSYSSDVDTGWALKTESLDGLSGSNALRFAFRYFVADTTVAGNYAGIDAVGVRTVPEPLTAALVGVGLLGAAVARRRQA